MKFKAHLVFCRMIFLLLVLCAVRAGAEEVPRDQALRVELLADFDAGKTSKLLDLTKKENRDLLRSELVAAGLTSEQYPRLYQIVDAADGNSLEACEALHHFGKHGVIPFHEVVEIHGKENTADPGDQVYSASALSSMPNIHDVLLTVLTLGLYDEKGKLIPCSGKCKPVQAVQDYGHQPVIQLRLSPRSSSATRATAQGTFLYVLRAGSKQIPCAGVYMAAAESGMNVTFLKQASPADINHDGVIRLCLSRTTENRKDCDEYYPEASIKGMAFQVFGYAEYSEDIEMKDGKPQVKGNVWIARKEGGGFCPAFDGKKSFSDFATVTNAKRLEWKIPRQDFGDGSSCIHEHDPLLYYLQLGVKLKNIDQLQWVYVTNDPKAQASSNLYKIPANMHFVWGCLRKGTQVTLKDGKTTKAIELLKVGDQIRNHKGEIVDVAQRIEGNEAKPLVCIEDDKGHKLCLTDGHPVLTATGPKLAKRLVKGESIVTEKGTALITKIEHVSTTEKVYNLLLGFPHDQEGQHKDDETTLLANGIAVGDARMQKQHGILDRRQKGTVLERLPKDWHKDYESWCKESGACSGAVGMEASHVR